MNQAELCETFGLSERTASRLVRAGLPCVPGRRGESHQFDSAEVHRWLLARHAQGRPLPGGEYAAERARLTKHEADIAARKSHREAGEHWPVAVVRGTWRHLCAAAERRLLALPARYRKTRPEAGADEVEHLAGLLREALAELDPARLPDDLRAAMESKP